MCSKLWAFECKSYFDSGGVHAAHVAPGSRYAHRYKLLHEPVLRTTIISRLKSQCLERGLCDGDIEVGLGLIYGHATPNNRSKLEALFNENGWKLIGPDWLQDRLCRLAEGSYENNLPAVVSKPLLRGPIQQIISYHPKGKVGHEI